MYVCTHARLCVYMHACMYICMYVHMYVYKCVHLSICLTIYLCVCVCVCVRACADARVCSCACAHTHTHTSVCVREIVCILTHTHHRKSLFHAIHSGMQMQSPSHGTPRQNMIGIPQNRVGMVRVVYRDDFEHVVSRHIFSQLYYSNEWRVGPVVCVCVCVCAYFSQFCYSTLSIFLRDKRACL